MFQRNSALASVVASPSRHCHRHAAHCINEFDLAQRFKIVFYWSREPKLALPQKVTNVCLSNKSDIWCCGVTVPCLALL